MAYKATVRADKGTVLGGGIEHTSWPFRMREHAEDWAGQCARTNRELKPDVTFTITIDEVPNSQRDIMPHEIT